MKALAPEDVRQHNRVPGFLTPRPIGGGDSVTWSRDGSELFYRIENRMMAVGVSPDGTVSTPTQLFEGNYFGQPNGIRNYHVAPDGRFLMLKSGDVSTDDQSVTQVVLVQNWFQELTERVPIPYQGPDARTASSGLWRSRYSRRSCPPGGLRFSTRWWYSATTKGLQWSAGAPASLCPQCGPCLH